MRHRSVSNYSTNNIRTRLVQSNQSVTLDCVDTEVIINLKYVGCVTPGDVIVNKSPLQDKVRGWEKVSTKYYVFLYETTVAQQFPVLRLYYGLIYKLFKKNMLYYKGLAYIRYRS